MKKVVKGRLQELLSELKITGGTPEVRSDKILILLNFDI